MNNAPAKPQRNEPCPCGSMRKYKKCCGVERAVAPGTVGYLRRTTRSRVSQAPVASKSHPVGNPGTYWVEFTLRPHALLSSDLSEDELRDAFVGDSHLIVSGPLPAGQDRKHVMATELLGTDVRYHFFCNAHGRLSHANLQLTANDFAGAITNARKGLEVFLAGWSVTFNVPLSIFRIRAQEEASGDEQSILLCQPYPFTPLPPGALEREYWVPPDFRALDYYREALAATSVKYQFLCFFKVTELVGTLRTNRDAEAKAKGAPLVQRPRETIGDEAWFRAHLAPDVSRKAIGKTFNAILDAPLRPLRNAIAHGLLKKDPGRLIADDEISPWLPVVKLIAERLVAAEVLEQRAMVPPVGGSSPPPR